MKKGLLDQSVFALLTNAGVPVEEVVKEYDRLAEHYHQTGINKSAALDIWRNKVGPKADVVVSLIIDALCDASCEDAKAKAEALAKAKAEKGK